MIKQDNMTDFQPSGAACAAPTDAELLEIASQQDEADDVRYDLSGDEWADYILSTIA